MQRNKHTRLLACHFTQQMTCLVYQSSFSWTPCDCLIAKSGGLIQSKHSKTLAQFADHFAVDFFSKTFKK